MKKTQKVLDCLKYIDDLRLSPDELDRIADELGSIIEDLPIVDFTEEEEDKQESFNNLTI